MAWTKWYQTEYMDRRGRMVTYDTKTLTPFHAHLRALEAKRGRGGITVLCDATVDWPFGLFGEVVGRTDPTPEDHRRYCQQKAAELAARRAARRAKREK